MRCCIGGANEQMVTLQVVTQFYPSEGFRTVEKNFTIAFFLPFKFQVRLSPAHNVLSTSKPL